MGGLGELYGGKRSRGINIHNRRRDGGRGGRVRAKKRERIARFIILFGDGI